MRERERENACVCEWVNEWVPATRSPAFIISHAITHQHRPRLSAEQVAPFRNGGRRFSKCRATIVITIMHDVKQIKWILIHAKTFFFFFFFLAACHFLPLHIRYPGRLPISHCELLQYLQHCKFNIPPPLPSFFILFYLVLWLNYKCHVRLICVYLDHARLGIVSK